MDDDGVAIPGIDLYFDRVGFDPVNRRRTDLGRHAESYDQAGTEVQREISGVQQEATEVTEAGGRFSQHEQDDGGGLRRTGKERLHSEAEI